MSVSLFRDQEIRLLPRLLESLMLGFDQNAVNLFVQDHCHPDCLFELHFHYGDGLVVLLDPGQPTAPAKRSFVYNSSNITKFLEHIHVAIPDSIFLIHDSQFLSKSPGIQVVCKFSFSGFAIFDSDMDAQSFDQAPSPKHFQQLLQASTSLHHSSASASSMSLSSSSNDGFTSKKIATINFMGDITAHSTASEISKRKISNTVGKYVDSKHLDTAYEMIKKSKERNNMKSRKSSLDHSSSTLGCDTSIDQESYHSRSMSVDTIDSGLTRPAVGSRSYSLDIALSSLDHEINKPGALASPPLCILPTIIIPRADSLPQLSDDYNDPTSPIPTESIKFGTAIGQNTQCSISSDSCSHDTVITTIPSIFISAPRKVQSGGVLKIWLPDDGKKIGNITVIAYCYNPPSEGSQSNIT
jgi:hypothetical protein